MLPQFRSVIKSAYRVPIAGAFLLVLAVNLALAAVNPFKHVEYSGQTGARGWAWWATRDFQSMPKPANVVVVGSSAVMHPLWLQEAEFRNRDVDLVVDHESKYLETVIKKFAPGIEPVCFNFGLPGSMASDYYMIVNAMFKDERKPKILVIGVNPRDLMDNTFSCAASSPHYKHLANFVDTSPLLDLAMPQLWRRVAYQIESLMFLKNKHYDVQLTLSDRIRSFLMPAMSAMPKSQLDSTAEEDRRLASYTSDVQKGVWIAHPKVPRWYVEATDDCRRRFRKPNDELFTNQKTWLRMCLDSCKRQGIMPVLVNMPITDTVRLAMPPGTHDRHISTLIALSKEYNCPFVDIDVPNCYVAEDFTDWIHMDAAGGKKALDRIGKAIGSNTELADRLAVPNNELAATEQQGL